MLMKMMITCGFMLALLTALWLLQDRLIYYPRHYGIPVEHLPSIITPLRYETTEGQQTAFYLAPKAAPLNRVWFVFGGNASLALDWQAGLQRMAAANDCFVLVDYPGFGYSQGYPSARAIDESSEALFVRVAAHLELTAAQLETRLALLGHSLGAAAALQMTARHRPVRIVLLSPFISLRAAASDVFGFWVQPLVRNHYDNQARLLALVGSPPSTTIVHGRRDEIIPVTHSRALAEQFAWLHYIEIEDAYHNDLFDKAEDQLRKVLQ